MFFSRADGHQSLRDSFTVQKRTAILHAGSTFWRRQLAGADSVCERAAVIELQTVAHRAHAVSIAHDIEAAIHHRLSVDRVYPTVFHQLHEAALQAAIVSLSLHGGLDPDRVIVDMKIERVGRPLFFTGQRVGILVPRALTADVETVMQHDCFPQGGIYHCVYSGFVGWTIEAIRLAMVASRSMVVLLDVGKHSLPSISENPNL
ncbi:hypothetical protein ABFA30_12430 [Pseudomonas sp. HLMP]